MEDGAAGHHEMAERLPSSDGWATKGLEKSRSFSREIFLTKSSVRCKRIGVPWTLTVSLLYLPIWKTELGFHQISQATCFVSSALALVMENLKRSHLCRSSQEAST